MPGQRKRYSAELKTKVAVEAIRSHKTANEIAVEYEVHSTQIAQWKKQRSMDCLLCSRREPVTSNTARRNSFYWFVPYPRNPFFTGRQEILQALHNQLGDDQVDALTHADALHGLGGIGKTQIALKNAYRYALEYSAILWLRAETLESVMSSLLDIAEVLHLPGRDDTDQEQVVAAVLRWLNGQRQWLLAWDNLEDLNLLQRFLPSARQGAILLITRQQALGTLARRTNLLPMEHEEGILFLLQRSKMLAPESTHEQMQRLAARMSSEYASAAELLTAIGGLPLALDQAGGAYIEETRCNLLAYLHRYKPRAHLLDRH